MYTGSKIEILRYNTITYIAFIIKKLFQKCSIATVLKYYILQIQYEMLLDIVTEYNSKVTFLSIKKKKSCVYKVYRVIQIIHLYQLF